MKKDNLILKIMAACVLTALLSLAVSCENDSAVSSDGMTVDLTFSNPSIRASVDSKGSIDGNNFPYSHTAYEIGLWLMHPGSDVIPQIEGFDNLKAEYLFADGVNRWTYYPFGTGVGQTGESSLHILKDKAVDIYAYHPWVEGSDDITKIAFVSGEDDWMTAVPIRLDEDETSTELSRTLEFRHLMTCIEVRIQCRYEGSISLTSMTLTDTEGRLVASGTFDCTAEDVSDAVTGSKGNIIKVEPKRSLRGGYWVSTYIMMPPVYGLDLASNEMKLSFVFNNIAAETEFYLPSTMKNSSVPVTEFERGYKYIYELKLDNTMDFRPVGIEKQWQTQTITLPI